MADALVSLTLLKIECTLEPLNFFTRTDRYLFEFNLPAIWLKVFPFSVFSDSFIEKELVVEVVIASEGRETTVGMDIDELKKKYQEDSSVIYEILGFKDIEDFKDV